MPCLNSSAHDVRVNITAETTRSSYTGAQEHATSKPASELIRILPTTQLPANVRASPKNQPVSSLNDGSHKYFVVDKELWLQTSVHF